MNKIIKILIADDEEKIRHLVRIYLEKEGFQVGEAVDGKSVLAEFSSNNWDLLVLDLMMPETDGWQVCREIRSKSDLPIIILTARGDEIDRVLGLELGADDYVVKPFSPRELVARIKALLRRVCKQVSDGNTVLHFPGLTIDAGSRKAVLMGQTLALTPKEFELLYIMGQSVGRVFTREQLLQKVWGYNYYGDSRTVDTHINRLREKMLKIPEAPKYVHTVWGVGYKFEVKG
nr:response regulator transcription factor [Desulfolucanica intricata]